MINIIFQVMVVLQVVEMQVVEMIGMVAVVAVVLAVLELPVQILVDKVELVAQVESVCKILQ
jgi:hypothetical protein